MPPGEPVTRAQRPLSMPLDVASVMVRRPFLHRLRAELVLDPLRPIFYIPYYYQTISIARHTPAGGAVKSGRPIGRNVRNLAFWPWRCRPGGRRSNSRKCRTVAGASGATVA